MGKRISHHLRATEADELQACMLFAAEEGFPLNLALTIYWLNFPEVGIAHELRLSRCQQRFAQMLQRHLHQLRWTWVREISPKGAPHTHLHAHDCFADNGKTFSSLLHRAFAADGEPAVGAIDAQPCGTGQPGSGGPSGWWKYMAKGLLPEEAHRRFVTPEPCGVIIGKRSGSTENLGRLARYRAYEVRRAQRRPSSARYRSTQQAAA